MSWRTLLITVAGIFFTLLFLNQAPLPYLWIWLMWLGFATLGATRAGNSTVRAVYFNAGVVVACFLCLEVYALIEEQSATISDRNYARGYRSAHPHLGYGPNKGVMVDASLVVNRQTVYDVSYTINATGQRIGPLTPQPGKDCILFFGGSFAFGEGLHDDETLPWRVGERTGLATINFGFHGYGPHQMLSAIQNGVVEEAATCKPIAAIYWTLPDHVFRVAGYKLWDADGPRYILGPDGQALRAGTFADAITATDRALRKLRAKLDLSAAYRRFIGRYSGYEDEDIAIFLAVIAASRNELQARYPGIEFSVLFWDAPEDAINARLQAGIEAIPSRVYRVSASIPDLAVNRDAYTLAYDGHPTAATNEKLANYVVQEILAVPATHGTRALAMPLNPETAVQQNVPRQIKRPH